MVRVLAVRWLAPLLSLVACGSSDASSARSDAADGVDAAQSADAADGAQPVDARDAATDAPPDAADSIDAGALTPCPVSGPHSFVLPKTRCSTLTPAEAGASPSGQNATVPSYAIAPDEGARGALVLCLNGSGGHPGGKAIADPTLNFYAAAASLGYAVLAVSYASDASVGSLCKGTDACFFPTRKSLVLGVAQPDAASGVAAIARDEGIVDRVARALELLAARDPAHGWATFLASADGTLPPEARIRWSAVTVAGHSQGSGHAAVVGKMFPVARVVQLSGPCDKSSGVPASWTGAADGPWATDPSQFYGLGAPTTFTAGTPTDGDLTCAYHLANWQNEAMVASHLNDAAATCGATGDTHGASIGCTDNYDAWQAMLR